MQDCTETVYANNTKRAYLSDGRHFESWCSRYRLCSCPAETQTVEAYLADHAGKLKRTTLKRRLNIIKTAQRQYKLIKKMRQISETFSDSCDIIWGIKPYQVGHGKPPQTEAVLKKRLYHSSKKIDPQWKPLLVGSNIDRYSITFQKKNLQYIKYGKWLMYPSNESKMLKPKILLRQTSPNLKAVYDDKQYYCQNSVFVIVSEAYDLKFLLGLLNSKLLDFLYRLQNPQPGKVFPEIKPNVIRALLIRRTAALHGRSATPPRLACMDAGAAEGTGGLLNLPLGRRSAVCIGTLLKGLVCPTP